MNFQHARASSAQTNVIFRIVLLPNLSSKMDLTTLWYVDPSPEHDLAIGDDFFDQHRRRHVIPQHRARISYCDTFNRRKPKPSVASFAAGRLVLAVGLAAGHP